MAIINDKIEKKYLILCEGKDAQLFVIRYINSDILEYDCRFRKDIQVMDFKGINDLSSYIAVLKNIDGYLDVTRILVLRDAETSIEKAINSVKKAFRDNDLPIPKDCNQWYFGNNLGTAFTLFPACCKNVTTGALEDLCWEILLDERADDYRSDVQAFIEQINQKYGSITTHVHKGRLHTYFSVKDNLVSLKVGEAARAGAFDWNHEHLQSLRKLIEEGLN